MRATVQIRDLIPDDVPFIVTTFVKSYKEASAYAEYASNETLAQLIRNLMLRWTTAVAVDPEDTTMILGWLIYRDAHTVGWLFVRPELRAKNLARALLSQANVESGTVVTPFAPTRLKWLDARYAIRFRPYLAMVS